MRALKIFARMILFLIILDTKAQTLVGVSNLDSGGSQILRVDRETWRASPFTTSSNRTMVSELIVRIEDFNGGDEFISLYNDHETENQPGSQIGTFQDNPQDLGSNDQFRFSPEGNIALNANTRYWLVFGNNHADTGGEFEYRVWGGGSSDFNGQWSTEDTRAQSADLGGTWNAVTNFGGPYRFSIMAIVPEPSTYALAIGLMLIGFIAFRRMHFAKHFHKSDCQIEIVKSMD